MPYCTGMMKILFGALMFLLGACAQQNIITHVNQQPAFQPSLISHAARDGAVPIEILGPLPAGVTAEELAQALRLPGRAEGVRLIPQSQIEPAAPATPVAVAHDRVQWMLGNGAHEFRIVLVFSPHVQTLPDMACQAANKIPEASGQDVRAMAVFCIGGHLAASGQVRVPAAAATPASTAHAINLLLSDMSTPPAEDGFGSGGHRR